METNVHHDVYNADVCSGVQTEGGGEGKREGTKKEKRSEWDREVGKRSGDEEEEENRREETESNRGREKEREVTIRERR